VERVQLFAARAKAMLKITYDDTSSEQRWKLSGQLSGPWVAEFRAMWEQLGRLRGGSCVVDLSDVTSIDDSGESLLRTMKADGARFHARGVGMKHILAHLRSTAKPSLRRSLAHLRCDDDCI